MAPMGAGGTLDIKSVDTKSIKPVVYAAAATAAIGGLIFGYDIGGSGGTFTMDGFREHMDWPPLPENGESEPSFVTDEQGWITSVFALGAVAGALCSGLINDKLGRRIAIIIYAFIFTVSAIIQGASTGYAMLLVGRFIGGIGVGGLSMSSTCYQSEIAPQSIRGLLVALQQLSITFGIFLAALFNIGLKEWSEGWRFSYCGNGILSLALFFLMFLCPESPRWLYKVGRETEARAVLKRIHHEADVEPEMTNIAEDERIAQAANAFKWSDLFSKVRNMRYRTAIAVAVTSLQQLTGINAIMYFAPVIFAKFLDTTGALLANLAIMFLNFVSTFITIAYVDKYGRRTLMTWGAMGMTVTTCVVCFLSSKVFDYEDDVGVAACIVVFCAAYVICFAFSWGPVGWIIPAEVFPLEMRGKGMTLSTAANWLWNFVIGRITPELLRKDVFDLWGTFLFFAAWCAFMIFFSQLFLPETKGVPLEGMDAIVAGFRRIPLMKRLFTIRLTPADELSEVEAKELGLRQMTDATSPNNGTAAAPASTVPPV